jgi:hypothetical protein
MAKSKSEEVLNFMSYCPDEFVTGPGGPLIKVLGIQLRLELTLPTGTNEY